jgi:hypothetical protein
MLLTAGFPEIPMADDSRQLPNYGLKNLGNYRDLGRGPFTCYFRRLAGTVEYTPDAGSFARLAAFTSKLANGAAWGGHGLKYIGNAQHEFKTYEQGGGIYELQEQAKLSVAGDSGTGTDEAENVICKTVGHNPDYTIHLGDVYYVGDGLELKENCLGGPRNKKKVS